MFGRIKEKLRLSVWKVILVKKTGTVKAVVNEKEVDYPKYEVVAVKYVNPKKKKFKHKIKIEGTRKKKPFEYHPEVLAYTNKESHVSFIDVDTGDLVKLGGGTVTVARLPHHKAVKEELCETVGSLLRGRQELMLIIFALVAGVGLGYIINNLVAAA